MILSTNLIHRIVICLAVVGLMYQAAYSQADETDRTTHEIADRCAQVQASVEDAGFGDRVSIDCDSGHAHLSSSSYPDHELMTGIVGSKPNTRDSALAVAVNEVPIFDYTRGGEMSDDDLYHHQTQHDTLLTEHGVDHLVFTQNDSGARSLDYSHKGEAYYIRYKPSDAPDCYDMETKTVANEGVVKTGVYCR